MELLLWNTDGLQVMLIKTRHAVRSTDNYGVTLALPPLKHSWWELSRRSEQIHFKISETIHIKGDLKVQYNVLLSPA